MPLAYIALGANLDDPVTQVSHAVTALRRLPRSRLLRTSSLYRTAPVGIHDQPDFINAVAAIDTELLPEALLEALLGIEADFGRRRDYHHAPRTLDLDLLLYDRIERADERLVLPHPRLHRRAFVLVPLREVAPDLRLPNGRSVSELLDEISFRVDGNLIHQA